MKPYKLFSSCCLIAAMLFWTKTSTATVSVDAHLPLLGQLIQQEIEDMVPSQPLQKHEINHSKNTQSKPSLLAIYGVGKRLAIEVLHDGVVLRYASGQHSPVGWVSGDAPLRLRKIAGRCASLEHDGDLLEACMPYAVARHKFAQDDAEVAHERP